MRRILLVSFLLVCSLCANVWAQERKVTGKVTSAEDGNAIPGVSIVLKGSSRGANTDAEGNYAISLPASGGTLVVSFVGTTTQEIAVGNRSVIDVKLVTDSRQLTEVVVTGVGVATDKRKLGIAVESVSSKNLPQTPTASIDQALVGKIAGAQISSGNGTPGAPVNIVLRGINTINRGTAPILIIDGVQVDASSYDSNGNFNSNPTAILSSIDPNTIERVEVVQGAAAATLYGAQGANGVIQVFTKRGKSGKLQIDISSGITRNTYLNVGGVAKSQFNGFVTDAQNNVIGTSGKPLTFDPNTLIYSENVQYNPLDVNNKADKPYTANLKYIDHYDYFFKPSTTYNNSISLSGGRDKFDFAVSASNNQQESNIINNGGYQRSNIVTNIGAELAKGLTFRTTTQLIYTKNTIKSNDRNILYTVNNARPFADFSALDPDGNPGIYYGDAVGVNHNNPSYWQRYTNNNDNKIDIIQNLNLNYKLNKFIDLDAKYGINYSRQEIITTYPNQTENRNVQAYSGSNFWGNYATDAKGEIDNLSLNSTYQNFLASAFFNTDFQNDFKLNIPIRTSTQIAFDYRNRKSKEYNTYSLSLPTYEPFTAAQASSFKTFRDYTEPFITYGYLVNQRIDFGDLAGVSGGFRTDFSSAFGQASKPFTFPRGDAYFRISALKFWENSPISGIFPEFKFRAAYGQAGIQPRPFDRYQVLNTRTLGNANSFYTPASQPNPDLNVEVSSELEIGTDLALTPFKSSNWLSSIRLSATYWNRSTDNAIYDINAAPSSGINSIKDNAFSLGSHGFQASLNANIFRTPTFSWNLTTNFGRQTSEITAVKGGAEVVVLSNAGSTNYVLKAGEKIGQLYGNVSISQVDARDVNGQLYIPADQQANYTVASNGYVVSKATKQPFFSANKYSFGDPNPLFNMSFINEFTFKNFLSFGFQFDWVQGSHVYNQTKEWMYRDGIHADYAKPFTIEGQTGAWTAFYRGVYAQRAANGTKDYFYEDASFVRLRNVQVGVDFSKIANIPVLRRAQLVLSGRNLLTFTKYTGYDPEISSGSGNSAWDRGTDHNTMPNVRSYQATLNIGF
ncbi:SusC/RagA family TonB-linked outer membrane protein [Spirosoma utsteinense]|uniref:TonB-linked SusC/RagA family outer membrane protein n=1 Tax=Spirosoma utsteinense TaxID=2585773 RepID=A0ABR6W6W7_9BACT|nr:SusC/RagA family TonB-linked outer membrane protein [Spirosoma utsteinense]MBC3786134.1 TonB-linked SusC/RagA family outer membrane protein [Spirosoma utsteinense]MBC3792323.1 TonB-linked SusC/RagA family outer membrane protein [Spirosoma utsteinense]